MMQSIKILAALNAGIIFLISIIGRDLQHVFFGIFDEKQFYLVIAISFVVGFVVLGKHLKSQLRHSKSFIIRACFCITLMLISQTFISRPEEKLHLLLFSFLGFFCSFFPKIWVAVAIAILISLGDEVLQQLLPRRYFGWDDVMINAYASLSAIIIFRYGKHED